MQQWLMFVLVLGGLDLGDAVSAMPVQESADVAGYYIPLDAQPNDLHLRWIQLVGNSSTLSNAPPKVELRIGTSRGWVTYRQAQLTLSGSTVRFTTQKRWGTHYTFEGEFVPTGQTVKLGGVAAEEGSEIVLRGTLSKVRRGTIVRGAHLAFSYTTGD
jgi:hypothetical protein